MMDEAVDKRSFLISLVISIFILSFYFLKDFLFYKDFFVVCDVGQGDGIYLRLSQQDIILDTGYSKNFLNCLGKNMPFWDKKIELVIISHPHIDHYGSLSFLADIYKIDKIILPYVDNLDSIKYQQLKAKIASKRIKVDYLLRGHRVLIDDFTLRFLWPSKDFLQENTAVNQKLVYPMLEPKSTYDLNDFSYVIILERDNISYAIFTGDVSIDTLEKSLRGSKSLQSLKYFKVPHHGSVRSFDTEMYKNFLEKTVLISVGENNPYNHPSQELIKFLEENGTRILRTDKQGDIKIYID